MRLTPHEIATIRACTAEFFGPRSVVRLFGSRTDDALRGGDIDLHVEAETADAASLANELRFRVALEDRLGEQRVDVVVRPPAYEPLLIDQEAVRTGVVLR